MYRYPRTPAGKGRHLQPTVNCMDGSDLILSRISIRTASSWLKFVPWGLRELLLHINDRYGDVPIYITENGMSDHGGLDDADREEYYKLYINQMLKGKQWEQNMDKVHMGRNYFYINE